MNNKLLNICLVLSVVVLLIFGFINNGNPIDEAYFNSLFENDTSYQNHEYFYEIKFRDLTVILYDQQVYSDETYLGTIQERAISAIEKHYGGNFPIEFRDEIIIIKIKR